MSERDMKFHGPENKSTIALQLGTMLLRAMRAGVSKEEVDDLWKELLIEEVHES